SPACSCRRLDSCRGGPGAVGERVHHILASSRNSQTTPAAADRFGVAGGQTMNENELKRAFETPAPDESAKQKAIRLALEEFELTKSQTAVREETQQQERASRFLQIFRRLGQGFFKGSRPTGENNPQRIEKMNLLQNKLLLSGLATSTLVVAGLVIFNQNAINQFQQLPDGVQIAQKPEQDVMLVAASSDAEVSRDLPAAPVPELAASTIHQPQPMAARAKQFSPQYSATLQKPA